MLAVYDPLDGHKGLKLRHFSRSCRSPQHGPSSPTVSCIRRNILHNSHDTCLHATRCKPYACFLRWARCKAAKHISNSWYRHEPLGANLKSVQLLPFTNFLLTVALCVVMRNSILFSFHFPRSSRDRFAFYAQRVTSFITIYSPRALTTLAHSLLNQSRRNSQHL